jgi:UDP-N-acetylglucosamine/UDP-N-acetylgalactosamine diphosphorylase
MTESPSAFDEALRRAGQEHVLAALERLPQPRRQALRALLSGIDIEAARAALRRPAAGPAPDAAPPQPWAPMEPGRLARGAEALPAGALRAAGLDLLRRGAVAACVVADGPTGLRWRGPLGTYPATPVTGKPLFRCWAEQIRSVQERHSITIPLCILTGPHNDDATRAFFADNNCFGLRRRDIIMLCAPPAAVLDGQGRLLLDEAGAPVIGGAGSGALAEALEESGAGNHLAGRGVEAVSFVPVENPLGFLIDPLALGLHGAAGGGGEITLKVVGSGAAGATSPRVAMAGGRLMILDSPAGDTAPGGAAPELPGCTGMGVVSLEFLRGRCGRLPPRRLDWPGAAGAARVATLIEDAASGARAPALLCVVRGEEHAPIRAASGPESAAQARRLLCERAARWLEGHGVAVPRTPEGAVDATIEIGPLTALAPEDLAQVELPRRIDPGSDVVL